MTTPAEPAAGQPNHEPLASVYTGGSVNFIEHARRAGRSAAGRERGAAIRVLLTFLRYLG